MEKLSMVYHGHVFDSSGYGNAARAYVHALHAAGVELSDGTGGHVSPRDGSRAGWRPGRFLVEACCAKRRHCLCPVRCGADPDE